MAYKIALIGEAWGEQEEQWKRPFVGPAGQELNRMLLDAGILREECYTTNVFNLRPLRNDIATLCCNKTSGDSLPGWPAIAPAKYIRAEYEAEVNRLLTELEDVRPNVAVLLGNTATWALLRQTAISKIRGATANSPVLPWLKCLPTYHPSAVLRQYELRHVTVLDLAKARVESGYPEIRRPNREIWLDPSLDDIRRFLREYITPALTCAFDIETVGDEITCIGFAPSIDRALVIPFHDARKSNGSYWETLEEELEAWRLVQSILSSPCAKCGQNTIYDCTYLWQRYGITVENYSEDTMLLHHALQPESPKGLDFLGSVYTNNPAWKIARPRGKHTEKKEE